MAQPRSQFNRFSFCCEKLAIYFRDLLTCDLRPSSLHESFTLSNLLGSRLGLVYPPSELVKLLGQPLRCLARAVIFHLQRVADVDVRQTICRICRKSRIVGGKGHPNNIRSLNLTYREAL